MKNNRCPKCTKLIEEKAKEHLPFCSKVCQEADLYCWLSEEYSISRELTEEEWENPKIREQLGLLNPYDPNFS